jgi:signal transduction histidine kinase
MHATPQSPATAAPLWSRASDATRLVKHAPGHDALLTALAGSVLPQIADFAIIAITAPDGSPIREFSAHRTPAREEAVARLAAAWPELAARDPAAAQLLREHESGLVQVLDRSVFGNAVNDDRLRTLLRELEVRSLMVVPLVSGERHAGSLLLATTADSRRRYSSRDVPLAHEVARRVSQAVEHAMRYYALEQAAQGREELMAVVAHDLKNPLMAIHMAVRMLLDGIVPSDGVAESGRMPLHIIDRSVQRMHRLVQDLLGAAAADSGKVLVVPAPLAVDVLVSDALDLLRPLAAPKQIAVVSTLDPALPLVAADRERILQVFSNLGGNALEFTPKGGRIDIHATRRGALVEFSVIDTGHGIAADDLPHVFDRFWRSKKRVTHAGVGLGLAIARGIVEAHAGEIRVDSSPGCGTRLTFTLPAAFDCIAE